MSEDRRRPAQYLSQRDALLKQWIAGEVYPYSTLLRPLLDSVGGRSAIKSVADLAQLPILDDAAVGNGRSAVLEPSEAAVKKYGSIRQQYRFRRAALTGGRDAYIRQQIDPIFRPLRWIFDGDRFVAWTGDDLSRLGEVGRRALSIAGIREVDLVVALNPQSPRTGQWQLQAGCRISGVPLLHLGGTDSTMLGTAGATVVAGIVADLEAAISLGLPATVRLLLVISDVFVSAADRASLARAGVAVVVWWAPRGVRARWAECGAGPQFGFHTFPDHEYIEVVDDSGTAAASGSLLWSAVGWRGSVWLRYRTDAAGTVDSTQCPGCGRTTPRVHAIERPQPVAATLDES